MPDELKEKSMGFEIDKPGEYVTRCGEKAVVLCVDAPGERRFVGYIVRDWDGRASSCSWLDGGYTRRTRRDLLSDIVGPWVEPLDFDWDCLPAWAVGILCTEFFDWYWCAEHKKPFRTRRGRVSPDTNDIGWIPKEYMPKNYTGTWQESWHWRPGCDPEAE